MMKIASKYTNMRIRYKVSLMAFLKNQTVLEFLLKSILNCYKYEKATKQFPKKKCYDENQALLDNINNGKVKLSLIGLV